MWSEQKLQDLEKVFRERGSLYICVKKQYEDVKVFLHDFFRLINNKYDTFYADKVTYQCGSGKNRSLEDVYRITITLFPDLTLKQFIKELYSPAHFNGFNVDNDETHWLYCFMCCDINKLVHLYWQSRSWSHNPGRHGVDELGFSNKDILEIVNS